MKMLDCTFRDGGYHNSWNFPIDVVDDYLESMAAVGVDIVELGFRSLINDGFKGACAYSTDSYLSSLTIPASLGVAVMINATEIVGEVSQSGVLQKLFPLDSDHCPVDVVRIACHVHEFVNALPACVWLKERGYIVCFNLMQVGDRDQKEVEALSFEASRYPIDVLYVADSMGSMTPVHTSDLIGWLRKHWKGALGVHTHDNMGLALSNTLQSVRDGVTWLDSTVTGMGRGPGNARTEELVIEVADMREQTINMVPLMTLIRRYFQPLKRQCGWGSNPYYYLAGKYGIHPTYIQEMLGDSRYSEEDIFAAIEYLRLEGGKRFSGNSLDASRDFFKGDAKGTFEPAVLFSGKRLLLLGTGPGVCEHRAAVESFIRKTNPIVIALNTQSSVDAALINYRVACHPVRLLADCEAHLAFPQPLITPFSMLPLDIRDALKDKEILDFGLEVSPGEYKFDKCSCKTPTSLVVAYALSLAASGNAQQILMAGFDGYGADDPRNPEMDKLLNLYSAAKNAVPVISITPTRYNVKTLSVYAI